jgi:hypothetical protein
MAKKDVVLKIIPKQTTQKGDDKENARRERVAEARRLRQKYGA